MSDRPHPLRYRIDLTPDLDRFQYKGQTEILLKALAPVDAVSLNVLDLAIWRCRLLHGDTWAPCAYSINPGEERLTVHLPFTRQGEFRLRIDFEGTIHDDMAGFYRSRYQKNGETRYLAVTQFQESSARRAFPCMDHPAEKAVFELSLTVPQAHSALSNTEPVREEPLENGLKRISFAPTPVMSTYLLFFGYGDFEAQTDDRDPRVRVLHLPGLAHTTDLGREFGRQALAYCEEYYGIAYPLSKMDLIAVPDFAFGAMENWGAITFRENLLLRYPGVTSKAGVQRICEIIAHEIAHQWFGNLVTPSDWKYLWLNESFATFFGYGVVDHYHPQWRIWDQFLNHETATAMARDGLRETFAIEIPGGEHVVINSSTAPIIYNKGASILRMIQGHIGHDAYRKGVQAYLDTHRYACASSQDLWAAFEKSSDQPITAMMQSWINQPGHPLVSVRRRGDTLDLRQDRFTYLNDAGRQSWLIPFTLTTWDRDRRPAHRTHLLDAPEASLDLPPDTIAYKLNSGQTGFFRVAYEDEANLEALGDMIADRSLPAVDRWGIQNDLYALVRRGSAAFAAYLAFLSHYSAEPEYLPLISIADHLFQARLIAPAQRREEIAPFGRHLAESVLRQIGHTPAQDEPQTISLLREQLLWQAVCWGSAQAADFALEQFDNLTGNREVHPDIAKSVLLTGALFKGQEALEWLIGRFKRSASEHERMNILLALGAFSQWDQTRQALAFALEQVPPRNRFIPIVAAAANPANQPHLWSWYLSHLQSLETFHPLLYERVITGLWPYCGIDNAAQVREFADNYLANHAGLTDAIRLALENLEINARMRARMQQEASWQPPPRS